MSKINFNNIPEEVTFVKDPNAPVYMRPGIHRATISGVVDSPEDARTSYLLVGFVNENKEQAEVKLYLSDKAAEYTARKIKHLYGSAELMPPEGEKSTSEINADLTGKQMWLKVSGDRKIMGEKEVIFADIRGFKFTASLANKDALSYDATKDIVTVDLIPSSEPTKASDNLPF